MARNPTNYLPINIDPLGDFESRMRNAVGGDPNYFRYGRYGLLSDDSNLKARIEGGAPSAPNNSYRGSGTASYSFGGGKTSSDPGGYNWDTLNRNLNRVSGAGWGLIDSRRKNKMAAAEKAKDSDYVDAYQSQANKAMPNTPPNYSTLYTQQASSQTPGTTQSSSPTPLSKAGLRRPGRRSPYSGPQPPALPSLPALPF